MNKLLFPLLSLLAAVGLYFMYIAPTYEEIKILQAKEAEFDQAFLEVREVRNILEELESSYAGISREDLLKLEIFLPKEIDIARVVQNIGGIVGTYDVPMKDTEVRSDAKKDDGERGLRKHEIGFSIDASYEDFLSIISDIENNIQLANVSSIELKSIFSGGTELNIADTLYSIKLILYSFE